MRFLLTLALITAALACLGQDVKLVEPFDTQKLRYLYAQQFPEAKEFSFESSINQDGESGIVTFCNWPKPPSQKDVINCDEKEAIKFCKDDDYRRAHPSDARLDAVLQLLDAKGIVSRDEMDKATASASADDGVSPVATGVGGVLAGGIAVAAAMLVKKKGNP